MSTADGCRRSRQREEGVEYGEYEREYRFELRSEEDGEEAMEDDGVEVMVVGEVERKSLIERERLKSENGKDGSKCRGD